MAFAEYDRVQIRHFLGYGATWLQAFPLVENAITAVQSVSDGGSRPDSSTETWIKALIYGAAAQVGPPALPAVRGLVTIEASIANQDTLIGVTQAGKGAATLGPLQETARLKSEGRRLCKQLARMLGMKRVIADVFGTGEDDYDGSAYDLLTNTLG